MQKLQHVQYHCQSKLLKKLQLYVNTFCLSIYIYFFLFCEEETRMWKKALICYLIIIYRQIIWFWGDLASLVRLEYLTEKTHSAHSAGQVITLFSQFRPDYYFYFLWSKGQNLLPTLGGQIIYFIYKNCKKFNFFQNQNDTCAHLFTFVMKFHNRQSSERCIRKLISRHCLDKTRTRWNDFLFLIRWSRFSSSNMHEWFSF